MHGMGMCGVCMRWECMHGMGIRGVCMDENVCMG
jgi:hypothetical protein